MSKRAFSQMKDDMEALAVSFEADMNKIVVDSAAEAGKNVAEANPIDTGLSSGNWQGATGAPIRRELLSFMPTSSIQRFNVLKGKKKRTGEPVFISNPVPYLRDLNVFATSGQQPVPFWVERESEKGIDKTLRKARLKR